jgi:hypothetical protein
MLKNDTDHSSPSAGKENFNPNLRRSRRNRPQRFNFPAGKSDSVLPPLSHDSRILEIWTVNPSSLSGEPIARKKSKKNHDRPESDNLLANPPPADEPPRASDQLAHPSQDDNGNVNHPELNQIFLAVKEKRLESVHLIERLQDAINAIADMNKRLEDIAYVQQGVNRLVNPNGRVDGN